MKLKFLRYCISHSGKWNRAVTDNGGDPVDFHEVKVCLRRVMTQPCRGKIDQNSYKEACME